MLNPYPAFISIGSIIFASKIKVKYYLVCTCESIKKHTNVIFFSNYEWKSFNNRNTLISIVENKRIIIN